MFQYPDLDPDGHGFPLDDISPMQRFLHDPIEPCYPTSPYPLYSDNYSASPSEIYMSPPEIGFESLADSSFNQGIQYIEPWFKALSTPTESPATARSPRPHTKKRCLEINRRCSENSFAAPILFSSDRPTGSPWMSYSRSFPTVALAIERRQHDESTLWIGEFDCALDHDIDYTILYPGCNEEMDLFPTDWDPDIRQDQDDVEVVSSIGYHQWKHDSGKDIHMITEALTNNHIAHQSQKTSHEHGTPSPTI